MSRRNMAALLTAFALFVGACAAPATETPTTTPGATPTEASTPTPVVAEKCTGQKVSLLLSFFSNVQHLGFLVAEAKGYYDDEGIDVDVQPGGPGISVVSAVGDGSVDVGQVDYGELVRARAQEVPIKAIAQVYQKSFIILFALKTSGIASVAGWAGKRVGQIQVGDNPERDAMILAAGLTVNDVTLVQQDFGIDDFTAGNVDVGTGVVFFHPAAFNLFGGRAWPDEFNVFVPDDHGAPISSQTLAVNEEYLASDSNKAALRCLLRATIRGWRDAFTDKAAALEAGYTLINPDAFPLPHQEASIDSVLEIVATGADDPSLLRIDPARYERSIALLTQVGYLQAAVNAADTYDASIYDTMGPIE